MSLKVTVVQTRNIAIAKGELFCIVNAGGQKYKTKAKKLKAGSTLWKQSFSLDLEELLTVEVWIKGKVESCVGETNLDLGGMMLDGSGTWFSLVSGEKNQVGELLVEISAVEGKKKKKETKKASGNAVPSQNGRGLSASSPGPSFSPVSGRRGAPESPPPTAMPSPAQEEFSKKSFETGDKMPSSAANEIKKRTTQFVAEQAKSSTPYSDKDGEAALLDLSACGATYLPYAVGQLTQLRGLSLAFNKIKNYPQLAPFNCLERLHLDGNQLSSLSPSLSMLSRLKELTLNGNNLAALPPELSGLTSLERFHVSNNKITSLCPEIGCLQRLEELALNGNPLREGLPRTIGNCTSLEVLDLSCCKLTSLPNEFTRMTRILELNLATNSLKSLPPTLGRMTRLVRLDLSDNRLEDLPVSMGYCDGLDTVGLEGNCIKNKHLLERYAIGTDHLLDFLQKRLEEYLADHPELEETIKGFREIDRLEGRLSPRQNVEERSLAQSSPASLASSRPSTTDLPLNEKIQLVKRDSAVLISEINLRISNLKRSVVTARSLTDALPTAQLVRELKGELDTVKQYIPPTVKPSPPLLHEGEDKLTQVKKTVNVALLDFERTIAGVQNVLLGATEPKLVVTLAKIVKSIHQMLDSAA